MPCFHVFSDKSLPVELTLYSPNNRMCLKKMRFSCLVLLHCGPFGCLCIGDKKWSSVIYIWSGAKVIPSVPRRCPWSDGGLVTGCLQGRCDRDVVIRGDWLHGWALEQMNIDRQSRNKLKLWPNLFIVLSKVENDLGDVSGPLSLEFLTHVQHRPKRLKCFITWIQQLHIFLLTTRTALPIPVMLIFQRRVDASTEQRPHHLDLGFHREISEPRHQKWTDKSPELHFFATNNKEAACQTLFDWMPPNKGDRSVKHLARSKQTNKSDYRRPCHRAKSNTQGKKNKKQRNKTKMIIKHLAISKQTNKKRDYRTPCHRAQPHAERFLELSVRWCPVRLAAAPRPPWGVGILYVDTKNFMIRYKKDVGPGVPVPTGQVQRRVRVDHRPVRRVLPHLGRMDYQYPGDVQKVREKN